MIDAGKVNSLIAFWELRSNNSSAPSSISSQQTASPPPSSASSTSRSTYGVMPDRSGALCDASHRIRQFSEDCRQTAKLFDRDISIANLKSSQRAYNGSVVRFQGQDILAFRLETAYQREGECNDNSIAMVALSANHYPIEPFSLLATNNRPNHPNISDDPRLFVDGGALRLIYNQGLSGDVHDKRTMRLANVSMQREGDNTFSFKITAQWNLIFSPFETLIPQSEKNWSPFVYDGKVHVIYNTAPHDSARIDEDLDTKASGGDIRLSQVTFPQRRGVRWDAGECRGGTPAVYDSQLDRYITFFHSSRVNCVPQSAGQPTPFTYYLGCATFQPTPPFQLEAASEWPIMIDAYARELLRPKTLGEHNIVFVQGLIVEDDRFILSYGRGDCHVGICSVDRKRVMDGMVALNRGACAS